MTENNTTEQDSKEKKEKPSNGTSFGISPETIEKIKDALKTPVPEIDDYWNIEPVTNSNKQKKILGIFKKKDITIDEINDLRKSAIQSPGNTRARIQKLKSQYPNNSLLYMLSAICTHGMLLNSSNQKEVVRGLKKATKEAAIALASDGISVYNCDNFFKIYFSLLDRVKRNQVKNYETIIHDPRINNYKQPMTSAMRISDQLLSEKSKVFNVLNHIKKKLKSSQYSYIFSYANIKEAVKHIENGNPKEKCGLGTASEIIAYSYALIIAFSRTPILHKAVKSVIEIFPDSNRVLLLRKISVKSVQNFNKFKFASIQGNRNIMATIGKQILQENMVGTQKLEGQSLYQSYETDPFFNIAYIAEMTYGLYKIDNYNKILDKALSAVETVIKRDMSKNHVYTDAANNHTHKLNALRDTANSDSEKTV